MIINNTEKITVGPCSANNLIKSIALGGSGESGDIMQNRVSTVAEGGVVCTPAQTCHALLRLLIKQ